MMISTLLAMDRLLNCDLACRSCTTQPPTPSVSVKPRRAHPRTCACRWRTFTRYSMRLFLWGSTTDSTQIRGLTCGPQHAQRTA